MENSNSLNVFAEYDVECVGKDGKVKWVSKFRNLVPTVGKNKFLDATLKTGLATPAWYVGLKLAGAPANSDTMGSHGGWSESTAYSNTNRPALTLGAVSNGAVDNSASKAQFNINATATIAGAFVVDDNTKGGNTGTLLSVGDFASSKSVENGDTLNVTVTFTAS